MAFVRRALSSWHCERITQPVRVKFRIGRIVYLSLSRDGSTMGFAFPKEWRDALVEDAWAFTVPKRVAEEYATSRGYYWFLQALRQPNEISA